jgi:gliding motility-associated-like protein
MRLPITIILFFLGIQQVYAQLDTIHFLPPLHARDHWGPQFVYLSTPEEDPFDVEIRDGGGAVLVVATISNDQPYRLDVGSTSNTQLMVTESQLHAPMTDKGMVFVGSKKFYTYFRSHSGSRFHACDLTCKGRSALGTEFRIAHLLQETEDDGIRANFIGFLATEDSTVVSLSGYSDQVDFRKMGSDQSSTGVESIILQKGESAVFSQYINFNAFSQPPNGLMGSLLKSNKPIAVNVGSWCGAPVPPGSNDIGIDQIAPVEEIGKEYILCKGNGSSILERPILIAHFDNTQIRLNGQTDPYITLQPGEHVVLPTSVYTTDGNLFIEASEPIFVYQMIGGAPTGLDQMRTAGLIFVPPVSCAIPNAVDNIFEPNAIGTMFFEGGLMIVAMRDSLVEVKIDGVPVSIGSPAPVQGYPDFVTYRKLDLFSEWPILTELSVVAEGAVQVAMFGRNAPASFAAFFSGFGRLPKPDIELSIIGDGVCPDTLIAEGSFEGVQWMLGDSVLSYGTDTFFVAYTPGAYIARGYLGVCRQTDFSNDTLDVDFTSPIFPFAVEQPSCFGYEDGLLEFGTTTGGLPPYSYSIDGGQSFFQQSTFQNLIAGTYPLIARDSTGCYNRPLEAVIGQPDSFTVQIEVISSPQPLFPGGEVQLQGKSDRTVVVAEWDPGTHTDFLNNTLFPEVSQWVELNVLDSNACPASDRIWIEVRPNIYAPNVFRPASNQLNDRFTIMSRDPLPLVQLDIYDRWGSLVFRRTGIETNDLRQGWDGTIKGEPALPGVYVFYAEVELVPGLIEKISGDVTLIE